MKAEVYVSNIKRVIPICNVPKNRKLKGEVDSQLTDAFIQQELLLKRKRRIQQTVEGLTTNVYSMQATELFYTEMPQFDHKA